MKIPPRKLNNKKSLSGKDFLSKKSRFFDKKQIDGRSRQKSLNKDEFLLKKNKLYDSKQVDKTFKRQKIAVQVIYDTDTHIGFPYTFPINFTE